MQRTTEYDANPNGFLTGNQGDVCTHIGQALSFVKTGGTSNTGWIPSDPFQGVFLHGEDAGGAPLDSPSFTGTPVAPTAAPGTNTTQIATTAFVIANGTPLNSPSFTGTPTAPTAAADTNTTQLATTAYVQGELVDRAPIASPTFTGTPAAPTAALGTNTTQIATTAFVLTAKQPVIHAQATTPYTVLASDSGKIFTNEGATAKIVFNLPTAVAGYVYTFIVKDSDGIQVVAASGDTIRIANAVSAAAGNADSTNIGSTLTLVTINATEWMAINSLGVWNIT